MNHTCPSHPSEAGTRLPTPEGWKAELALAVMVDVDVRTHRALKIYQLNKN